jgi:arylsulfatase A-like enzyme
VPPKNLICVVVDRLHAGLLGAYGNSWIHTAHFDRLACQSFLFDQAFVDCPRLNRLYRSYWLGLHAAYNRDASAPTASFVQLLRASGWHTALVTDEPEVAGLQLATDFAESVLVESPEALRPADDVSETQIARLFGTATAWLQAPRQPFCLWLHARGMAAAWDAPLELRNQYADLEDPPPPEFTAVPNRWLSDDFDPDELLGVTHAYAGQVSLVDACLGALVDQLQQAGLEATTQLTLLGARGFPLGEHLRVGVCDESLYGETAQIPWLMRFPDGLGKLARSQALVQPADLPGTLLDWLELDRGGLGWARAASLLPIIRDDAHTIRTFATLISRHEKAIRTPAWLLRQPDSGAAELYSKPGDRWEVSEIANLCPEIVTGLQAALAQTEQPGEARQPPPLAEALVREVD